MAVSVWRLLKSKCLFLPRNYTLVYGITLQEHCAWNSSKNTNNLRSTFQNIFFIFALMIALKTDEKCFLFHLQSSFLSQDIWTFILSFWACRKNGLIRKIRLISKLITSQPGEKRIAIHKLLNISRIKGN